MITFNLKKIWFEKIKLGEKTHEYREIKPYWEERLFNKERPFLYKLNTELKTRDICFVCGYAKKEEKNKFLYGKIKHISTKWGRDTDLNINKNVFDIEFELIKE